MERSKFGLTSRGIIQLALIEYIEMNENVSKEVFAAIAYALHEELGKHLHDAESFVLTIKRDRPSAWALKTQTLRTLPR